MKWRDKDPSGAEIESLPPRLLHHLADKKAKQLVPCHNEKYCEKLRV